MINISYYYDLIFDRDEDMQSVASLMSIGKTDIGIMEDVEEESSKEFSTQLSEITSELSKLECSNDGNPFGNPFDDDLDLECDGFFGIVCLALFIFLCCLSSVIFISSYN